MGNYPHCSSSPSPPNRPLSTSLCNTQGTVVLHTLKSYSHLHYVVQSGTFLQGPFPGKSSAWLMQSLSTRDLCSWPITSPLMVEQFIKEDAEVHNMPSFLKAAHLQNKIGTIG